MQQLSKQRRYFCRLMKKLLYIYIYNKKPKREPKRKIKYHKGSKKSKRQTSLNKIFAFKTKAISINATPKIKPSITK